MDRIAGRTVAEKMVDLQKHFDELQEAGQEAEAPDMPGHLV